MRHLLWRALCLSLGLLASLAPSGASAQTAPVTTRMHVPPSVAMKNLSTWRWGDRFFPTGTTNGYVVILVSRECPDRFNAYGYDLSLGRMSFFVSGPTTLRSRFVDSVQRDLTGVPDTQRAIASLTLDPHLPTTTPPTTSPTPAPSPERTASKTRTTATALTLTNRIACASPPETELPDEDHPIFPPDLAVIHTYGLALTEQAADQGSVQKLLNAAHTTGP